MAECQLAPAVVPGLLPHDLRRRQGPPHPRLLQQRAASKITFPNVWTNTVCSHPLFGQAVEEVDKPMASDSSPEPIGIKHAAVRKIRHELGTKVGALHADRFKYMGRVHYWAADTVTWGPSAPWGEHEIDYLLLYQLKKGETLELDPHPDEVMDVACVSPEELKAQMADTSLLWSPWFRVIVNEPLLTWWRRRRAHAGRGEALLPHPLLRRCPSQVQTGVAHKVTGPIVPSIVLNVDVHARRERKEDQRRHVARHETHAHILPVVADHEQTSRAQPARR